MKNQIPGGIKMINRRNSLFSIAVLFAGSVSAIGQTFAATGTTGLSVVVGPEAAISITTGTTTLAETSGVGAFGSAYVGTTNFSYKVRTTNTGGSGTITMKVTVDFGNGTGTPSVATPAAGDTVTYTCTATSTSATACTGPINASTSATNVATMGTNAHSAQGPAASDTGSLVWTVPNDPAYKTATYTATALFTIAAL
jgi:hypothetical protein